MSLVVRKLRRADTYEHECQRTTYRLHAAMGVLGSMGLVPTKTHDPECRKEWVNTSGRSYACQGEHLGGVLPCLKVEWPDWVTDEHFEMAYSLADSVITARGRQAQMEINRMRNGSR